MEQSTPPFRWIAPPRGPAATPADLALWASGELLGTTDVILVNPRDLSALSATMLANRVRLPDAGVVQPGTLWLAPEV